MTANQLTPTQIAERNSRVVDDHLHAEGNENVERALALYASDVVWESPSRGLCYRTLEDVKQNYLRIWESTRVHSVTMLRRRAAENWVFDDSVLVGTLVGDVATNLPGCPLPSGANFSLRLVHYFELDDEGRITRENVYEMYRRADQVIDDDIPTNAPTISFE
jgi:steroid delta-isomerase-like uncharacterized protein